MTCSAAACRGIGRRTNNLSPRCPSDLGRAFLPGRPARAEMPVPHSPIPPFSCTPSAGGASFAVPAVFPAEQPKTSKDDVRDPGVGPVVARRAGCPLDQGVNYERDFAKLDVGGVERGRLVAAGRDRFRPELSLLVLVAPLSAP